jgi:predicted MFS family arabinose efflux permease
VLALANFAVGTGSQMLPGMLIEIAADLGRPVSSLGLLVAIAQLAGGITAPFLAVITSRLDRRSVLLGALLLCCASHFLTAAAAAAGFSLLLAARAGAGVTGTAVTPQSAGIAALLAHAEHRGRAVGTAVLGYHAAAVFGVPLGVALAGAFGWRTSFVVVGATAAVCALLVYRTIPARLPIAPLHLGNWGSMLRNRAIALALVFNALQFAGQNTWFAYLAPLLHRSLDANPSQIALLLSWFGCCGVSGSVFAARFVDRIGAGRLLFVSISLMLAAMLLWPLALGSTVVTLVVMGMSAFGAFTLSSAQQAYLVGLDARFATLAVAFNVSAGFIGASAGALLGASLIRSPGYGSLNWTAAVLMAAALGVLGFARMTGSKVSL